MSSSGLPLGPASAGSLRRNVASLSVVQAANYLLPFITVPYLVRVLGADRFGEIAFGQAFAQYFVIITDFGFNFSGTRLAAIARDDPEEIERLYRAITLVKLALMSAGAVVLVTVLYFVPRFRADWMLFAISYIAVLGSVLFPAWLFQGLEQMGRMAALSLAARVLAIIALFLLVHQPADYLTAAALQASATPLAGLMAIALLCRRMSISIRWLPVKEVRKTLAEAWPFFLSSGAATLYTSTNVFILGLLQPPVAVAYYSAADKVIRASLMALQPVIQALYPRMSYLFSRDAPAALRYLRRFAAPLVGIAVLLSTGLWLAANPIVHVLFGRDMGASATILRLVSAVPALVAISNVLGVQLLFPLGYQSLVSRFQIVTGLVSIAALFPMVRAAGARGSALNYVVSEAVITAGFLIIALHILKSRPDVRSRDR